MSVRYLLAGAAVLAAACSPPTAEDIDASLRQATVQAIPGAGADDVQISNPKRSTVKWEWQVAYAGQAFACDSDDKFRLPSCSPVSPATP